jgi:DNA-binding LytR/AlgR family response regulator
MSLAMNHDSTQLSCIIVDDEPLAVDILEDYVNKIHYLNHVATFDNGMDTLHFLKEQQVDLVFLDIQMPNLTGIQLMEVLNDPPMVVFTTAYENYALKSYEYEAVDYLLKPIEFERFLKAVEKAFDKKLMKEKIHGKSSEKEKDSLGQTSEFIFVKTEYRMQKILIEDILYIEGMKNYLRIATKNGKIMTLSNFRSVEKMLPESNFHRIHKSYIVAIDKIENIERNRVKIGDMLFPVSETYKDGFYRKIDNISLH